MMLHSIQGISARKGETTRAFVERYDAIVRLKNGIEKLQKLVDKGIQPRSRFEYNDLLKQKKKGIGGIGMSEKNDKKWYKNIGIWLIVFGVALFVVNIVFACIYDENGTNIFTAISGWVSGIATIILGVIAIVQNRKYKRENDRFLKEQQQLNWKLEQKDLIKSYLCKIENIFSNVKEFMFMLKIMINFNFLVFHVVKKAFPTLITMKEEFGAIQILKVQ